MSNESTRIEEEEYWEISGQMENLSLSSPDKKWVVEILPEGLYLQNLSDADQTPPRKVHVAWDVVASTFDVTNLTPSSDSGEVFQAKQENTLEEFQIEADDKILKEYLMDFFSNRYELRMKPEAPLQN